MRPTDRDKPLPRPPRSPFPYLGILVLSGLAGCASPHGSHPPPTASAAQVRQYAPPGPPSDPWGPYIAEAAARFAVPEVWIREVMRQESGGQQYLGGSLTTSAKGAIGLMQVMPTTYEDLRQRYGLGSDPYHPRDNILAGTAYLREMHDRFGVPAFLAAYNAGPRRVDEYMSGRPLPAETVNYVASIAPRIGSVPLPASRFGGAAVASRAPSAADLNRQVLAGLPAAPAPARPAPSRPVYVAEVSADELNRRALQPQVQPPPPPPAPVPVAAFVPPTPPRPEPRPQAHPAAPPLVIAAVPSSAWAVQVGAFSSPVRAKAAAETARDQAGLRNAEVAVGTTSGVAGATLYRARLVGLSGSTASAACDRLSRQGVLCVVLPPDAQT